MDQTNNPNHEKIAEHTAVIVASFVAKNNVTASELPTLINSVYNSMSNLGGTVVLPMSTEPRKPAVSIRKSVTDEYLICLEDGKKLKMLKRHLRASYDMSPDEYRARWGLPADYPMVAPNYAERRSAFAKAIGLGTRQVREAAAASVARRSPGRPRKAVEATA